MCPGINELRHGNGDRAMAHLDRVNGWTPKQTEDHVVRAMSVWRGRSLHPWTLDLSWLDDVKV